MNSDDLIRELEELDIPEVTLSGHQRRLKTAVLRSGALKRGNRMPYIRKVVAVGGALAAVAVIALVAVNFRGGASQASAQELAHRTERAVADLSPERQQALKQSVGADTRALLQEAQAASDLKKLTYDEFASQAPVPPDPDGRLRSMEFLQFTRTTGEQVVLGIDGDGLPGFASIRVEGGAPAGAPGDKSFHTSFEDGSGPAVETVTAGE